MTTKTTKAEKRRINRELRDLRKQRTPLLTGRWLVDAGRWGVPYCDRPCGVQDCEGCITRAVLREHAAPLTARIEELKQELQQLTAEPAPLREATVVTGRGEQLVMFV